MTSWMRGTFSRTTSSSVRSVAQSMGSAAFLLPLGRMLPLKRFPPCTMNLGTRFSGVANVKTRDSAPHRGRSRAWVSDAAATSKDRAHSLPTVRRCSPVRRPAAARRKSGPGTCLTPLRAAA
jgi:hypothetical protein